MAISSSHGIPIEDFVLFHKKTYLRVIKGFF
ncbi:MAG: Uncharacterised protein [Owenweeksia sp. TMED14]|nr:MAG: Uncharacterised protein [Owenweeksia sp. TMED14]